VTASTQNQAFNVVIFAAGRRTIGRRPFEFWLTPVCLKLHLCQSPKKCQGCATCQGRICARRSTGVSLRYPRLIAIPGWSNKAKANQAKQFSWPAKLLCRQNRFSWLDPLKDLVMSPRNDWFGQVTSLA